MNRAFCYIYNRTIIYIYSSGPDEIQGARSCWSGIVFTLVFIDNVNTGVNTLWGSCLRAMYSGAFISGA